MKTTLSGIKADIGSIGGHTITPKEIIDLVYETLHLAKLKKKIKDFYVTHCGDDLELLISHNKGVDSEPIHSLAFDCFEKAGNEAIRLGYYGAKQDILKEAFTGNVRGMGPGVAEIEFTERINEKGISGEPFLLIMMDKTEPGSFNYPLYKAFADPTSSTGIAIDPAVHTGFTFEVWDIKQDEKIFLKAPEELYDLHSLATQTGKYVIKRIYPNPENPKLKHDEPVAVVSTDKLFKIAGKYKGKDDPIGIIRAQNGLPATGEVLDPFADAYLVRGWMRGSHIAPLMPVSLEDSICTRFDGPPRVNALAFSLRHGKLHGPIDCFKDPSFNKAREKANEIADYLRKMGNFQPAMIEETEYTTMPQVLKKLKDRFEKIKTKI